MIDTPLPPVVRNSFSAWGETLESFALCYLSAYGTEDPTSRPWLSYQRAWGFDRLNFFPSRGGTDPGFIVAYYTRGSSCKVIVALPGYETALAMYRAPSTLTTTQLAPAPGTPYTTWLIQANIIKT